MKLSNDIGTVINVVPNVDIDRNKKKSHFWCFIELQPTLDVQIWESDGDWGVRTHQEKNENFIN